ncbi:PhoH family protein [Alteribacter populi]|uniref:PhoH family protein n=1 Tax=Alteribacter populi TaxID=2011011 RepID=UPI000BBB5CC7|nr:PhoH family protein [Alteribacter populi]
MPLPKDSMFFGFAEKLTDEQRTYVDSIFDNQLTIVNAKGGTGKTTLAVAVAKLLDQPMIYTFSPVEEGAIGHTPGTVEEKEEKYIQPLLDALDAINEDARFALYRERNPDMINDQTWIRAKSHTFVRGTNIIGSTVIIDEAQNLTRGELKKLLTRIHRNTKVVMIGHTGQCDLKNPAKSGFEPYLEWFRNQPYAQVCELTENFRSPLAQHADELTW